MRNAEARNKKTHRSIFPHSKIVAFIAIGLLTPLSLLFASARMELSTDASLLEISDQHAWQLSTLGPLSGHVDVQLSDETISLYIDEVCHDTSDARVVRDTFDQHDTETVHGLKHLGFLISNSSSAIHIDDHITLSHPITQPLLVQAPTVFDSDNFSVRATLTVNAHEEETYTSIGLYSESLSGTQYGVRYIKPSDETGRWELLTMKQGKPEQVLRSVEHFLRADGDTNPIKTTLTLVIANNTLNVLVNDQDISLQVRLPDADKAFHNYGFWVEDTLHDTTRTLDDLTFTDHSLLADCPALKNDGQFDERYPTVFVHQTLDNDGEIIATLSEHVGGDSGLSGLAIRAGVDHSSAGLALLVDSAQNSLSVITRTDEGAINEQVVLGDYTELPQALKLSREGQQVLAFSSTDGVQWHLLHQETIQLPKQIHIGPAVSVKGTSSQKVTFNAIRVSPNDIDSDSTSGDAEQTTSQQTDRSRDGAQTALTDRTAHSVPFNFGTIEPLNTIEPLKREVLPTFNFANVMAALLGPSAVLSDMTTDTTLVSGTTYLLNTSITIADGVTLTIPGDVRIEAAAGTKMLVQGNLIIHGTETDEVMLTSQLATPSRSSWQGIEMVGEGTASIRHAVIRHASRGISVLRGRGSVSVEDSMFEENDRALRFEAITGVVSILNNVIYQNGVGVYFTGSTGSLQVQNNTIANNYTGLSFFQSTESIMVINNDIRENTFGLNFHAIMGPATVTGNTITQNAPYGIRVAGTGHSSTSFGPVVTQNNIFGNSVNYRLEPSFGPDADRIYIDARTNWWGTSDPVEVAAGIQDRSDTARNTPFLDYTPYRIAEDGPNVTGIRFINGVLEDDTIIDTGVPTYVMSSIVVPEGKTFTIQPGVHLQFNRGQGIEVHGRLVIEGSASSPVVLNALTVEKTRHDWLGIQVKDKGTVLVRHGIVQNAASGVSAKNGRVEVSIEDSTFEENTQGLAFEGITGTVSVADNSIRQNTTGIYFKGLPGEASIAHNVIEKNNTGLYFSGILRSVAVTENTIRQNANYGVFVFGTFNSDTSMGPVVTKNKIYDNVSNYYLSSNFGKDASNIYIDARNNWWGSSDPAEIAAKIRDRSKAPSGTPYLDYGAFKLNEFAGPSPYRIFQSDFSDDHVVNAGEEWLVTHDVIIPAGKSLTLKAGSVLRVAGLFGVYVQGSLVVEGSATAPVVIEGLKSVAEAGAWKGISVLVNGALNMRYAHIRSAQDTIQATAPAAFSVEQSIFARYASSAITLTNHDATGRIHDTLFEGAYRETGLTSAIILNNASPSVRGNTISNHHYGMDLKGASNPAIIDNGFTENDIDIRLMGTSSTATSPNPVINQNDFINGAGERVVFTGYGSAPTQTLDLRENWWGTQAPSAEGPGRVIHLGASPVTLINFSNALSTAQGSYIAIPLGVDTHYFSPLNSIGTHDTVTLSAVLTKASAWTLRFYRDTSVVLDLSGNTETVNVVWDGKDAAGNALSDDVYRIDLLVGPTTHQRVMGTSWVMVDNEAPTNTLASPLANATLSTNVSIAGTVQDGPSGIQAWTMAYRPVGVADTEWVELTTSSKTIIGGTLHEWLLDSDDDSVKGLPVGEYQLRLEITDKAGNSESEVIQVDIQATPIFDVSTRSSEFNIGTGEPLRVQFSLPGASTVRLEFYDIETGDVIWQGEPTALSAGQHALEWDGKHATGDYVKNGAYAYRLQGDNGVVQHGYAPNFIPSRDVFFFSTRDSFDPVKNDFLVFSQTLKAPAKVNGSILTNGREFSFDDNALFPKGTHEFVWDGRDADHQLVFGAFHSRTLGTIQYLPINSVIVRTEPKITGRLSDDAEVPTIEVKPDPFLAQHSYDQISRFAFTIDQAAAVTVAILPPGITDITDSKAVILADDVLYAAKNTDGTLINHAMEWSGYQANDGNAVLVADDGFHNLVIQARSQRTGQTATYYGVLQLYR